MFCVTGISVVQVAASGWVHVGSFACQLTVSCCACVCGLSGWRHV